MQSVTQSTTWSMQSTLSQYSQHAVNTVNMQSSCSQQCSQHAINAVNNPVSNTLISAVRQATIVFLGIYETIVDTVKNQYILDFVLISSL